jgi:hypothetical protein
MAVHPEILFDRYFQEKYPYKPPLRPEKDSDRRPYRGRHDLSGLPPMVQEQLRDIQAILNEALRNEKQGVLEHVDHPPFHVDYVDSSIPNALAFRYEGYSFIAITIPLIHSISEMCLRLSESPTVASLLGVRSSDGKLDELNDVLFYILVAFIVLHEWAHHVHGHVPETVFLNEILDSGCNGNMERQIEEIAADSYSVCRVLSFLINGDGRSWLTLLKLDAEQANVQDEVLFALVVVAVGAYLFFCPVPDLKRIDIYKIEHPPQVARMSFIIKEAFRWCEQMRPELEAWMRERFRNFMNAAVEATLKKSGAQVWEDQLVFFESEEGNKYVRALGEDFNAYRQSTGRAR